MKIRCLREALVYLAIFLSCAANAQNKLPQLGKDPIPDVIKAMTLEEKASMVVGAGLNIPPEHSKLIRPKY